MKDSESAQQALSTQESIMTVTSSACNPNAERVGNLKGEGRLPSMFKLESSLDSEGDFTVVWATNFEGPASQQRRLRRGRANRQIGLEVALGEASQK